MRSTAFIIGAGASVEFGFPTGPKLQEEIVNLLRADSLEGYELNRHLMYIWEYVQRTESVDYQTFIDTCRWMASAIPFSQSIDSFLETHASQDPLVGIIGKYAIAHIIARCEEDSGLRVNGSNSVIPNALGSWLTEFWRRAVRGISVERAHSVMDRYSFVTFNYDRCLERYMRSAYQVHFRFSDECAQSFVKELKITHVYGSLGPDTGDTEFGNLSNPEITLKASASIKTYSEQVDEKVSPQVGDLLKDAQNIIFLGFSFAPINTRFIELVGRNESNLKRVIGTSLGMSSYDKKRAEDWADSCFRRSNSGTELSNLRASELFTYYNLMF